MRDQILDHLDNIRRALPACHGRENAVPEQPVVQQVFVLIDCHFRFRGDDSRRLDLDAVKPLHHVLDQFFRVHGDLIARFRLDLLP